MSKIRYGIVLMCAGAVILATLVDTSFIQPKNREEDNPAAESTFPSDDTGNESENPESTDPTEPGNDDPSESEAPVVTDDREKELVLLDANETALYTGLQGYCFRRLKIDPEKVELYLNVREEPAPDAKILAVLYPADLVRYYGRQGDWYYVEANGMKGFVHASMVLTDNDAYVDIKDTVAYATMVKENQTYLYMDPHDDNTGVIVAGKSDSFRVVGMTDNSYEITGDFTDYQKLFVRKSQSLLYYMFLGPGNDNGLSNETERLLAEEEVTENLERIYIIQNEAQTEREAYESMVASLEEESRRQEIDASIAISKAQAEEESRKKAEAAANEAQRSAAAREAAYQQSMKDYDAAHVGDRAAYLSAMQADAAGYDLAALTKVTDRCRVTYYCHCTKCCKAWGVNDVNYQARANGINLVEDYHVAVDRNLIPIGTRLLAVLYDADGVTELSRQLLSAADTGVSGYSIDIYRKTHTYAQKGYTLSRMNPTMYNAMYYVALYIIP